MKYQNYDSYNVTGRTICEITPDFSTYIYCIFLDRLLNVKNL
jgi:hypothetical protein